MSPSGRTGANGQPNDPGLLGYAAAVGIAYCVNGAFVAAGVVAEEGTAGVVWFLGVWQYAVIYEAFYGLPFALVGVLLVHLTCRRVPEQWLHVAAAGILGVVTGALLWGAMMKADALSPQAALVGVATATGRAAVIPLVRRRRAVDHDFVPAAGR